MTERDLSTLKDLSTPAPRADAKARALRAAVEAFESNAQKEIETAPKETDRPARPMLVTANETRSIEMFGQKKNDDKTAARKIWFTPRRRALAASLVALLVAAPFALSQLWSGYQLVPMSSQKSVSGKFNTNDAPAVSSTRGEPLARPGDRVATVPVSPPAPASSAEPAKVAPPPAASPATATPAPADLRDYKLKLAEEVRVQRADAMKKAAEKARGEADRAQGLIARGPAVPATAQQQASVAPYPYQPPRPEPVPQQVEQGRDQFEKFDANPLKYVTQEPVSTFSLDVDTASYSIVRRSLNGGRLPPRDAVRVEEMINYFPYDYMRPETASAPFQPQVTVTPSPWNAGNKLVHIGVKGYALDAAQRPRANIVLLIDTSGSMGPQDRLPLLKNAFRMLVDQLKPDDTVGIVTYASGSDIRLHPTRVAEKSKIIAAIDSLTAGGSTAGANGIQDAYKVAEAHFDKGGVNRIILGTDGDFNVGITDRNQLKSYIEQKRETGIFLSILGVGMGNLNDALMQTLARNGNGVAAYIDTLAEARKVLVEEASSSIFPIAKDVKVQIEFNPATVAAYRLVGYEKRMLKREDFNNDKVDAGDVGSGHTVTAIYEVTPVGVPVPVDSLRYGTLPAPQAAPALTTPAASTELGFLKLRYKLPKEDASKLLSLPITPALEKRSIAEAPTDVRFSIAVAGFGQLLRGSPYLGSFGYDDVLALGTAARGEDPFGYRAEFLNLVRLAKLARP